jgi:coproporphyrinogen III oxidase
LNLRRQDPRGINGLFYGDFPSDKIADTLEDNLVTKTVNDAC